MTPRKRIEALFQRQPVDRMPLFSGLSMIVTPALDELGCRFSEIHTDAGRMARAAVLSARMMDFDSVVVPIDLGILPEALGARVNFYEDADQTLFPTVAGKKGTGPDEIEVPDDFLSRGRFPMVAEAIGLARAEAPEWPVGTWMRGPFTQLGQILELETVLKAAFKAKDAVAAALDRLADALIRIGQFWSQAGADYLTLSEPGASADVLPPRMFKQLVLPRLIRIIENWPTPVVLHVAGKSDPLVEMMASAGASALAVDHKNDLALTREKIGPETLLFGNFDVYRLPCQPEVTPDQAAEEIRRIMAQGVDAVWPGSDLWPDIKAENMRAMVKTVHDQGKQPSPAVGRLS